MGDLLGMGEQQLSFSQELLDWVGSPDFLIFNLEAQISQTTHLPLLKQSFKNQHFFKKIKEHFSQTKLIAGIANNHFHDFSLKDRLLCFKQLADLNYTLKGAKGDACLHLAEGLCVDFHTTWVDKFGGAAPLEDFQIEDSRQHLLFLHTGVEFKVDPDPAFCEYEKSLPENVLALIGHHSHRPSGIEWTAQRLVAWSLGNICTPFGGDQVRWGQVLKLRLKKNDELWSITQSDWSYLYCQASKSEAVIELRETYPFHEKIKSATTP